MTDPPDMDKLIGVCPSCYSRAEAVECRNCRRLACLRCVVGGLCRDCRGEGPASDD